MPPPSGRRGAPVRLIEFRWEFMDLILWCNWQWDSHFRPKKQQPPWKKMMASKANGIFSSA